MATIEQYQSGEAAKAVRMAYDAMQALETPLPESRLAGIFARSIEDLKPKKIDMKKATEFIGNATKTAVGDRMCKCEFPEAGPTSSVFLDELADAMVSANKAKYVLAEEAITVLADHKGRPLVASRVSGTYMEICRTWPKTCFYWNIEKRGMKCLDRTK